MIVPSTTKLYLKISAEVIEMKVIENFEIVTAWNYVARQLLTLNRK